jgi:LuxR family maltose regulon positive regulatory protein
VAHLDAGIDLLERLSLSAARGGRVGSVIDAHLLGALAHDARGKRHQALTHLDEALALAVPAGYVRLLLDEGAAMEMLLHDAQQRPGTGQHARTVLAAATADVSTPREGPATAQAAASVPEGLSEREVEVLQLLATPLTGPEISRRLFMTINTFRTHTRHIFTKLGVQTRRAAVARAAELHLL